MHTYTILTPNNNPLEATIEKNGIKAQFTLKQVQDHTGYLEKTAKELEGKRLVEDAKATNIIAFNSFLKDLTEEQIHATHLYFESMAFCKEAETKITELYTQIESYKTETEEILNQTGLDLTEVVTEPEAPTEVTEIVSEEETESTNA